MIGGEEATYQILAATFPQAAAAYDELLKLSVEEKADQTRVLRLQRQVERALCIAAVRSHPAFTWIADGAVAVAPDGSAFGPAALKRFTGQHGR